MTPAEAKMRILAEWRTWIGHKKAIDSHQLSEVSDFLADTQRMHPEILSFESDEPRLQVVKKWLTDAGLIK